MEQDSSGDSESTQSRSAAPKILQNSLRSSIRIPHQIQTAHLSRLHFGLRSVADRDWSQQAFADSATWPVNLECEETDVREESLAGVVHVPSQT